MMSNTVQNFFRGGAAVALALLLVTAAGSTFAHEREETSARTHTMSSTQLHASPSQVRLVQEKLREGGHDPGRVDGVWGESTAQAVRTFQEAKGLPATGQLDTSLLSALELGDVLRGETGAGFLDGLLEADPEDRQAAQGQSARGEGAPIFVSPVHIAQIQHLLKEQGHYDGEVDGRWGPATASAANEFRKAHKLEANRGIDIALLQAMNQPQEQVPQFEEQLASNVQGVPLEVGSATVRALQRQLAQEGHEAGSIDGRVGSQTRAALREFQRDNELEPTGTLTLPTLAALDIDVTDEDQQREFEARSRSGGAEQTEDDEDPVATAEDR